MPPRTTYMEDSSHRGSDKQEQESHESSVAASLCGECIKVYQSLVRQLSLRGGGAEEATIINIKRAYGTLVLWDDGYGVSRGLAREVLLKSRTLRRSILKLLTSIGRILVESERYDLATSF
jgi:hypothetical protein